MYLTLPFGTNCSDGDLVLIAAGTSELMYFETKSVCVLWGNWEKFKPAGKQNISFTFLQHRQQSLQIPLY